MKEDRKQLSCIASVLVVRLGLDSGEEPRQDPRLLHELRGEVGVHAEDILEDACRVGSANEYVTEGSRLTKDMEDALPIRFLAFIQSTEVIHKQLK